MRKTQLMKHWHKLITDVRVRTGYAMPIANAALSLAIFVRRIAPLLQLKLIRRATFDLTGLPPTPDRVYVFLADERSDVDAFAVLDPLLESPHYGERMAQ